MNTLKDLFNEIANEINKELESQNKKSNQYDKLQKELKEKRYENRSKIGETYQDRKDRRKNSQNNKENRTINDVKIERSINRGFEHINEEDDLITNDLDYQGESSMRAYKSLREEAKRLNEINRKTNSFTDTLYYKKNNEKNEQLKLEKINVSNTSKSLNLNQNKISKKLRKKSGAREAFINSIIFDRKI